MIELKANFYNTILLSSDTKKDIDEQKYSTLKLLKRYPTNFEVENVLNYLLEYFKNKDIESEEINTPVENITDI